MTRGTVRRQVRISCSPERIWELVGDPGRIQEWWPGIVSSTVDGTARTIITAGGLPMPEEIVTNDALQHRFQYRITAPMFRDHLSTLDVLDLGDGTSLAVYSADADPAPLALIIGGAAGSALDNLRTMMEGPH
jgi:hypothetical protein